MPSDGPSSFVQDTTKNLLDRWEEQDMAELAGRELAWRPGERWGK